MKHFGQDGYVKSTKMLMETTAFLRAGVAATPGLKVIGSPVMTAFAIEADSSINIYAVADVMEEDGGWKLERTQLRHLCFGTISHAFLTHFSALCQPTRAARCALLNWCPH